MTFINRSPKFHIETFICVMLTFWIYEQLKKTVTDLNITNYIHKTHRKSSSITHWKSTHYKKHKNQTVQIHIKHIAKHMLLHINLY